MTETRRVFQLLRGLNRQFHAVIPHITSRCPAFLSLGAFIPPSGGAPRWAVSALAARWSPDAGSRPHRLRPLTTTPAGAGTGTATVVATALLSRHLLHPTPRRTRRLFLHRHPRPTHVHAFSRLGRFLACPRLQCGGTPPLHATSAGHDCGAHSTRASAVWLWCRRCTWVWAAAGYGHPDAGPSSSPSHAWDMASLQAMLHSATAGPSSFGTTLSGTSTRAPLRT